MTINSIGDLSNLIITFFCYLIKKRFNIVNLRLLLNDIYNESFDALVKIKNNYDNQIFNFRIKLMERIWNKN